MKIEVLNMSENKVIDKQFKLDAVQYRKDHPELTFQQVADNLGVSNSSIHRWCKQFDEAKNENEDSNLFRGSGNFSSDEAKELARLKKENRDLKDAVEILKKSYEHYKQPVKVLYEAIKERLNATLTHLKWNLTFHFRNN